MKNTIVQRISIKKGFKVGELDAEADAILLDTCYIDNGQLEQILNVECPASIIVGRTGAGKSAMLYKTCQQVEHSVNLDPHDISARFLEHSNIIQFFNELDVKLDLFYKLLWRHTLTVELLKLRYSLSTETNTNTFLKLFADWASKDKTKKRATEYFNEWGGKFWLETEEHFKEITQKLTKDVKASLSSEYSSIELSLQGAKSMSNETRSEVKNLATQVINSIQLERLSEVLNLLEQHAFTDKQKKYYILIDKLDENWASTDTRCRFIRALIEETKSMRRISQVKVISAIRRDLLDLVFDKTRDSGFQEEKYEAYLVELSWSDSNISDILDRRISETYKQQYTKGAVKFNDIFPSHKKGGGETAIDYIVQRTFRRPRDAIQFVNECFNVATDRDRVSWSAMASAEAVYSRKRLNSLVEEWGDFYPSLRETVELIRGLPSVFTRKSITDSAFESVCDELSSMDNIDPCARMAKKLYEDGNKASRSDFIFECFICLYHTGVIGLKVNANDPYIWSYIDQPRVTKSQIKRSSHIKIHKIFRHYLEVNDNRKFIT